MECPELKGSKVASAWQPMSAATCTGPTCCCASFSAENTGRSGQPVQKPGGRAGSAPSAAATSARRCALAASQARAGARSTSGR